LGTLTSILQEHRYFIIQVGGESGQAFLDVLDKISSIVQWYGFARTAIGAVQLFRSLRAARRDWLTTVQNAEKKLNDTERNVVRKISQDTEEVLQNADRIEAEAEAAKKLSEAETKTVQTSPKAQHASSKETPAIETGKTEESVLEASTKEKVKPKKAKKVRLPEVVTQEAITFYDSVKGKVDSYRDLQKKVYNAGFGHLFETDHLIEERFFATLEVGLDAGDWPALVVAKNQKVAAQIPGYKGYDHVTKTQRMRSLIPQGYERHFTPQQALDAHIKVLSELGADIELVRMGIEPLLADFGIVFRTTFPPGYFDPPRWPKIGIVRVRKPKP